MSRRYDYRILPKVLLRALEWKDAKLTELKDVHTQNIPLECRRFETRTQNISIEVRRFEDRSQNISIECRRFEASVLVA